MNKLAFYLRRTAAKEVNVKFEQVVELIGEEKAQELAIFVVKKQEIRTSHIGRRSAVPAAKRINNDGLAGFNRRQLLEAILEAKGSDYQLKDSKGNDPEPLAKEAPDPNLLPDTKQREDLKSKLQAKGFTVD
jgi:hypothetical protein